MKAVFISDVHLGPLSYFKGVRRKLSEHSENYIAQFVQHVSETSGCSFAIQLGDLVQHSDKQTDMNNLRKGVSMLSRCPCSLHHLIGNHDTIYLTPGEARNILGSPGLYYSFDASSVHVVTLYSEVPIPERPPIIISEQQLAWLRSDLSMTDKPTLVFVHHSLADQDLFGNPWFEGQSDSCLIKNRKEVRQVLAGSGKVIAVVNGHLHWNRIDIHDGIPYITVQSAVESLVEQGVAANSWGRLELGSTTFRIEVFGNDAAAFGYDFSAKTDGEKLRTIECTGFPIGREHLR